VEGARHQDFLAYDPRGYDAHVAEFLMEALMVAHASGRAQDRLAPTLNGT
jgi:hypothetical protein